MALDGNEFVRQVDEDEEIRTKILGMGPGWLITEDSLLLFDKDDVDFERADYQIYFDRIAEHDWLAHMLEKGGWSEATGWDSFPELADTFYEARRVFSRGDADRSVSTGVSQWDGTKVWVMLDRASSAEITKRQARGELN